MRVLLVGDPDDARLARHGRFLADAGMHVHVAAPRSGQGAAAVDPRWTVHASPDLFPSSAARRRPSRPSTQRVIRRVRIAAARTSYRAVEAARALLSADIDPGPFALRPPVPWLESNDPLGPLLRAFALTPEIDVPWLTELIARVAPDAFTTFDFVPFGVLMLAVRRHSRAVTAPWMLALAETDLERVGHDPALATALAAVLADVDGLLVEREQEFTFAKSHGFRGTRVHAGPTCGGWRLSDCRALRRQGPASGRRVVAVSGARGVSGRPFVALRALHLTASALRDYKIVVYSPGEGVEIAARLLAARSGLEVELVAAGPDGDLLRPHGGARCSLALHASERTDPSLLDAAVMGSLPIGSVTCRADGRIRDGVTGLLVNPEDPPAVAAAVRRALADDALVDRAAAENEAMAEQRLSREVVGEPMLELYRVMARRQNVRPSR